MFHISGNLQLRDEEIEINAIRASGPGGQHVNKVASAVHLRLDINASSLPPFYKSRLLALDDQRISKAGVIVIKAARHRSLEQNREEALARLRELILGAGATAKKRIATRPSRGARQRRLEQKQRHGKTKSLRKRLDIHRD